MIPFVDISRQDKKIRPKIKDAVENVINGGHFILGPQVLEFEEKFASYCGTKYSVGVASGTDAILIALRALNVGWGDEVIVPANTFISTVLPILYVGAKPILVDIDRKTYNLDPEQVEKRISKKTKAIIPVHLYGQIAEMDEILKIAKSNKLYIVEDACQAHGSIYKGQKAGSFGDIGCFSFYPGKNLGAYGDGGIVTTSDGKLAEKIRILRDVGQKEKYIHIVKGYNSRLDTLQAAILIVKLTQLDEWNRQRRSLASLYTQLLSSLDINVTVPFEPEYSKSNYHLYIARVDERDKLLEHLKTNGIMAGIHYPVPIHLHRALKDIGYKKGDFPISEEYASQIISLPIFPYLSNEEVKTIVEHIKNFYEA